MNEEFELRKRLQDADPGRLAPALNETVVAQAALGKAPKLGSFRVARLTMAAASLSIVGLAVTSVTLPQQTQEPLFALAQSSGQAMNAAAPTGAEAGGKMAADSMMIWPGFRNNYIPGDLSKETGRGVVYQAELVGDPLEILRKLQDKFGISGVPKQDEWSTDQFPSYSILGEDFALSIYFYGTGSWSYSKWNNTAYSCESSADSETQDGAESYCEPVPTPELIPSEAEMKAAAAKLFADLGISVSESEGKVWRSEWGGSVNFPNVQNGINTGMDFYVSWGMDGQISYVSGHSFKVIERGTFNTISPFDSVARITDGRWFGGAPSSYFENMTTVMPMARDGVSMEVEPAPAVEGEKIEEDQPVFTEPEIQDLTVVRSEVATLSVYDGNGNLWFVPGYILFNDQGWFDAIISLEEGIIQLPEPFNYDVKPLEEPQG